ncbi:MAG: hypothetical protein ABSG35_21950 [Syntrophobacteraceae bacterium]|jgi:hypothetical protein
MARVSYLRIAAALSEAQDVYGLAAYCKKYYNTSKGAGVEEEFVENYEKYCH